MKVLKLHLLLTALITSMFFTETVLAAEPANTDSQDSTDVAVSTANTETSTAAVTASEQQDDSQPLSIDDSHSYYRKQFEERRRQMQEAQLEAYKQFLERRKQYSAYSDSEFNRDVPAYIQERRALYIRQMEERRAFDVRMMEEHRKAAEERRKAMQLKMHQTNTAAEDTKKV